MARVEVTLYGYRDLSWVYEVDAADEGEALEVVRDQWASDRGTFDCYEGFPELGADYKVESVTGETGEEDEEHAA